MTAPNSFTAESDADSYGNIETLDGVCTDDHCETSGLIPQRLFAFNIVSLVERKFGKIPCSEQTQFLNANLFSSCTVDGATITNNKNGSLTINGTVYSQSHFTLTLGAGTYYVGCFSDDNDLNYADIFRVRVFSTSSSYIDYPIGTSFTITGGEYAVWAMVQIGSGQTFNGTIWPIITKDSAAAKWEQFTVDSFAEKVNWLKNNISAMRCDWHGYGACPSGNKAYFSIYGGSLWATYLKSSTSSSVSTISLYPSGSSVQSDGFIYLLAYTDASDGTTASHIYTDYVSLIIAFK